MSAVEAYEDLRGGRPVNLPSNPSQAGITSRPSEVVAPRKEEGSLIQFDAEEEVPTADEVLAGRAGSASGAASRGQFV